MPTKTNRAMTTSGTTAPHCLRIAPVGLLAVKFFTNGLIGRLPDVFAFADIALQTLDGRIDHVGTRTLDDRTTGAARGVWRSGLILEQTMDGTAIVFLKRLRGVRGAARQQD